MTTHVVSIGGGLASTMILPERVMERYGRENVHFIMARLPNEDPDVWRLVDAVQARLGIAVEFLGRNLSPWDVFFQQRMMGSARIDPCSRILKREVLDGYVKALLAQDAHVTSHVGITYYEAHRAIAIRAGFRRQGWDAEFLLIDDPSLTRDHLMEECRRRYGFVPRLYQYGFSHNNCGGACVKAGHKEWARLLRFLPDVYEWWESNEQPRDRDGGDHPARPARRHDQELQPASVPRGHAGQVASDAPWHGPV